MFLNIIVFFGYEFWKIFIFDLDEGFVGIILGFGCEIKRDIYEGVGCVCYLFVIVWYDVIVIYYVWYKEGNFWFD